MPNKILEGTVRYCLGNKLAFIIVLVQLFLFEYIFGEVGLFMKSSSLIVLLIVLGYGLKVTQDVMYGGESLPKISLSEWFNFGVKGIIVYTFYLTIQASFLRVMSLDLNFPKFNLEELLIDIQGTVVLFYKHDPLSFIEFIAFGVIIVYITVFFMEIALARLADGGNLPDAFDFHGIKNVIDVIGWTSYAIDYTKIVLAFVILLSINNLSHLFGEINILVSVITDFMMFIVEYRGIGNIYREYKELTNNKKEIKV